MKKLLNSFLTLPSAASMQRYTLGLLGLAALALLVYMSYDLRSKDVELRNLTSSFVAKPVQYITLPPSISTVNVETPTFSAPVFGWSMTVLFIFLVVLSFAGLWILAEIQIHKYIPKESE